MIRFFPSKAVSVAMVLVAAGVLFLGGCKKKPADPFPATGVVSGWEKTGETRTFAAKDLWQYIDGDAEHYIQNGVVTSSTADYKFQGQLEAVVDVHTMGTANGASAILESGRSAGAANAQLGDAGFAFAQSVIFRKGTVLVRIVAYESKPGTQQALLDLAKAIEKRL